MSSKKKGGLTPLPGRDKLTPSPTKPKSTSPKQGPSPSPKQGPSPTQRVSPDKSSLLRRPEAQPSSDDFLRCDLCRHTIEDPRTLDCLHSYCRDCLMTYIFETASEAKESKKVVCPVCLQNTNAPAKGTSPEEWANLLPANDFIKGYLEAKSLKDPKKSCDTCRRQRKSNLAKLWCRFCHDALCESCVGFHNALKTTNGHDLAELAKIREQTIEEIMSSPLCKTHSGEQVTKYCEKHKIIVCEKCVASEHKSCKVSLLADAVANHKGEIDEVSRALTDETKFAKAIHEDRKRSELAFNQNQAEVLKSIESVRIKVNDRLKEYENEMLDEFTKLHEQEKAALDGDMKEAYRIHKSVGKVKGLVENAEVHGTESHVMQILPDAAREGQIYGSKLSTLNGKTKNTVILFKPDQTLEKLMSKGIRKLGDLRVSKTKAEVTEFNNISMTSLRSIRSDSDPEDEFDLRSGRRNVRFEEKTKPKKDFTNPKPDENRKKSKKIPTSLISSLNARTPTDAQNCWLTGIAFHPNGQIFAVDRDNSKIKIFSKSLTLVSETALSHQPYGLTLIGLGELAVTVPRENKIEVFTIVGNTLKPTGSIKTSEAGYGISYSTERGFVVACACGSPPSVKVIARSGEEKQDVCPQDQYLMPMFFRPWYVALDASGGSMFVSDCHKSHVTCITGSVIKRYLYQSSNIHSPRGLHVTKTGGVVLCGFGSDNIQLIGPNGEWAGDILGRQDSIIGPQDVALNEANDMMAVTFDPSSGNSDIVKLFKITLQ